MQTHIRSLVVGAVLGMVGVLAGTGLAHAECDQGSAAQVEASSYEQARIDADACDTMYGKVVRVAGGFEAYCVPDRAAEACIEVSSTLDCSLMSAERCDELMGSMFEACVALSAAVPEGTVR